MDESESPSPASTTARQTAGEVEYRTERRGGVRRTSWKPGQSGNPKGPPTLPENYKVVMNTRIGPLALQCMEEILLDPEHPRHEQMVEYALNRWKGTPTARTELTGPDGGPIAFAAMTTEEKRARLRELAAAAAARARGEIGADGEPRALEPVPEATPGDDAGPQ